MLPEEISQTQLELLNETVEYYSANPERRCVTQSACYYSSEKAGKPGLSEGCAIGRKLDPQTRLIFDSQGIGGIGRVFKRTDLFEMLPESIKIMEERFLVMLQSLHDNDQFWTKTSISEKGTDEVERIKDYLKTADKIKANLNGKDGKE